MCVRHCVCWSPLFAACVVPVQPEPVGAGAQQHTPAPKGTNAAKVSPFPGAKLKDPQPDPGEAGYGKSIITGHIMSFVAITEIIYSCGEGGGAAASGMMCVSGAIQEFVGNTLCTSSNMSPHETVANGVWDGGTFRAGTSPFPDANR